MRLAVALLASALAACGSTGDPAGPGGDPPPSGNPPGPAPAGPLPSLGGCQIFPADNAWNRDVSAEPVHPGSAALLAEMAPENSIHLDLGTSEEYYGIPYTIVPADQPLVPITFGTGVPFCSITKMFEGLRSRWINPFWCACWTAWQMVMKSLRRPSVGSFCWSQ